MMRTQIQFPDPLYRRLKEVAQMNDWPLAEVVRRATELYVQRFPDATVSGEGWTFPTIDAGGDFLVDPAGLDKAPLRSAHDCDRILGGSMSTTSRMSLDRYGDGPKPRRQGSDESSMGDSH